MNSNAPLIFDVPPVFKVESIIGQGSYGVVCKALYGIDQIAIKKIPNYTKSDETARRVLREIEILQNLQFCEQVVECRLLFRPTSREKDVYVVMNFLPSDLSSVIKNKSVPLNEKIICYITCQLLLALRAMHRCNVLHRDLSPRNILVNHDSQVFVCDFGLSRFFDPDEQLSFGVVTQWYRAPEIILDAEYDAANDIWGVGVIVCELVLRRHLFPGKWNDSADQLNHIFHLVGTPPASVFEQGQPFARASANARKYALSVVEKKPCSPMLQELLRSSPLFQSNEVESHSVIDLAVKLLSFNPRDRPTADDALRHPWFDQFRSFIGEMIETQDGHGVGTMQLSACGTLPVEDVVKRIEELVPIFSQDLLVSDDED
ncbi:protein kinase, putative [Trypanosoma equiperdum]|uniref:Protein kinase, putative n=2 Tax=Trypanozoon TaxID=39700 RepID=Q38BS3_TRYB2|nr:protein kinase, putative [Trypanosoma brucei brucei TREU927]EAN77747.1 protein kinase, putative [Trypanosoma brucei brucei TREU927]SCU66781.1 protein kinase, putative [Trypanosoma equiperdum]